jgi:hypothetical protein
MPSIGLFSFVHSHKHSIIYIMNIEALTSNINMTRREKDRVNALNNMIGKYTTRVIQRDGPFVGPDFQLIHNWRPSDNQFDIFGTDVITPAELVNPADVITHQSLAASIIGGDPRYRDCYMKPENGTANGEGVYHLLADDRGLTIETLWTRYMRDDHKYYNFQLIDFARANGAELQVEGNILSIRLDYGSLDPYEMDDDLTMLGHYLNSMCCNEDCARSTLVESTLPLLQDSEGRSIETRLFARGNINTGEVTVVRPVLTKVGSRGFGTLTSVADHNLVKRTAGEQIFEPLQQAADLTDGELREFSERLEEQSREAFRLYALAFGAIDYPQLQRVPSSMAIDVGYIRCNDGLRAALIENHFEFAGEAMSNM